MTDSPGIRQITDSRVLAAFSHPLRRRLMDVFTVDGPATASMLAEATGQAVGNVSHHLKVLASAELIEEVPEDVATVTSTSSLPAGVVAVIDSAELT